MKNNQLLIGAVIVVVLVLAVGGFLMRDQLKTMLGMEEAAPVEQTIVDDSKMAEPPAPQPTANVMTTSDNIYKTMTDATKGKYMTDFAGMTLYTFDKDTAGVSNCTANCLKVWPVYTSGATAQGTFPENVTVITASDGKTKQFAWKGMPLYYYASDSKAGDLTGDGVGGTWHIVKM